VKICDIYGSGFFYIPGTDTCFNPPHRRCPRGERRRDWRSLLPYPGFNDAEQTEIIGPVLYGSHLVVTTDLGLNRALEYHAVPDRPGIRGS
jgi:hypothetical protein